MRKGLIWRYTFRGVFCFVWSLLFSIELSNVYLGTTPSHIHTHTHTSHTHTHTSHTHARTISGVTELEDDGAIMDIHLGPALVFTRQSILTCPHFLEEVGQLSTYTHIHPHTPTHPPTHINEYHCFSERRGILFFCNLIPFLEPQTSENYLPYKIEIVYTNWVKKFIKQFLGGLNEKHYFAMTLDWRGNLRPIPYSVDIPFPLDKQLTSRGSGCGDATNK